MAIIVDPNEVVLTDPFNRSKKPLPIPNGSPDLSKMYIYAQLNVIRREGSVLTVTNSTNTSNPSIQNQNDSISINMMGVDSATGQYTTKWTNNYNPNNTDNSEGFGITEININTNSSFVPTVDIEFVDIRGSSLFRFGKKSKYSVLFDFPPPIFTLTVKGYYGKALTYNLHLVRHSIRFDAQSGNYVINANFVAQKFAPLTDILFKYIDVIPLMDQDVTTSNANANGVTTGTDFGYFTEAKNTRELIQRAKRLYDDLKILKSDSKVANDAEKLKKDYFAVQDVVNNITTDAFQSVLDEYFKKRIGLYIFDRPTAMSNGSMTPITGVFDYDIVIKQNAPTGIDKNINKRLYIAMNVGMPVVSNQTGLSDVRQAAQNNLIHVKAKLLNGIDQVNTEIKDSDITDPSGNYSYLVFGDTQYVGIDISVFYQLLHKQLNTTKAKYTDKQSQYKEEVNKSVEKYIGHVPTIRYIFSVLMRDVERVFKKLSDVGKTASDHHEKYQSKIFSKTINGFDGDSTTYKKITPFPTIIDKALVSDLNGSSSNTIERDQRGYPDAVFSDVPKFPETDFVDSFINAFLKEIRKDQLEDYRDGTDEHGNKKRIPINPYDTSINGMISPIVPYLDNINKDEIFREFLQRFYIQTQYSYGDMVYIDDGGFFSDYFGVVGRQDSLLKLLGESEAVNIVNAINDRNILAGLKQQASGWKNAFTQGSNVNDFYKYLDGIATVNGTNLYRSIDGGFTDTTVTPSSNFLILNRTNISRNRNSQYFNGFDVLNNQQKTPVARISQDDGSNTSKDSATKPNPVDEFLSNYSNGFIKNIFFDKVVFDKFTQENLIFFSDTRSAEDANKSDFLASIFDDGIISAMSEYLGAHDAEFLAFLQDPNVTDFYKAQFVVSMFGGTYSFFSKVSDEDVTINKKFAFPAIIELPIYAYLNTAAIGYFYGQPDSVTNAKSQVNYTLKKYPNLFNLISTSKLDSPNLSSYVGNMSPNDVKKLTEDYTQYINGSDVDGFNYVKNYLIALMQEVINYMQVVPITNVFNTRVGQYENRLSGSGLDTKNGAKDYKGLITDILNDKFYIINYTQLAFYPNKVTPDFIPLATINTNPVKKTSNDKYFTHFFTKMVDQINKKIGDIEKIEKKTQESISDKDIKLETYYSFKAVSDKWVLGIGDGLLGSTKSLIDEFSFIDRAGNDIGDKVVIDFSPLIEMSQDFDISVFTAISRLLSLNGFEFFPLQNFNVYGTQEEANDMFRLFANKNLSVVDSPRFVCMYIGGASSVLEVGDQFPDDGIRFAGDINKNPDFKTSNVTAFKVAFGKQNQSFFTNMELNTNEHKETNESLAILSNLARDQSSATPVPKGQNLFSVYEQRSYTCKVEMLGNMMIQPTQYFVLENVPMFLGAYIILQVQHNIVANHMKTNFNGVRIRRFPQPFVTDFATSIGIEGGSSDNSVSSDSTTTNNLGLVNPITTDQTSKLLSP